MGGVKGEVCPFHHMASCSRRVGPVNRLIIPVRSSSSVFVLKWTETDGFANIKSQTKLLKDNFFENNLLAIICKTKTYIFQFYKMCLEFFFHNSGNVNRMSQKYLKIEIKVCPEYHYIGNFCVGKCWRKWRETILSWTCHVYGPYEFRTSLGTFILLLRKVC